MPTSPLGVTYYPSCVVNMRVKFDESYQPNGGPTQDVTPEEAAKAPVILSPAQPQLRILSEENKTGSHVLGRIPLKASVELQSIRKPGKFTLVFDYRVLPIDPRLVRSAAVEIYMDSVQANAFAQGVTATSSPTGERISRLTSANRASMLKPTVDNLVLQGLVDSWRVEHTSSGSRVTLEGRDLTGMFLNTPITPAMVAELNLDKNIEEVVSQLVAKVNGWGEGLVVYSPPYMWPKNEIPRLANIDQLNASVPRVRVTAKGKKVRRSPGSKTEKLNFWDLITRYCGFVGAVPYITAKDFGQDSAQYKATIMIVPQRSLYDQLGLSDKNTPSPFDDGRSRTDDSGQQFKIRRLIFGRNIEELNLERKFQGITARAVRVVCYNPSATDPKRRFLEATSTARQTFAEQQGVAIATDNEAAGRSAVSPNGELGAKDVLTIQVHGIKDQATLQDVADGLYNEIMRGQAGGSVKTRSLSSFGAGNEDPDLVRIRPMDGIALLVDARQLQPRAPNVSPLTEEWQQSAAQWQATLAKELNDENLAAAIVATTRSGLEDFNSTYRVNAVRFDWDVKSGISIALDFHNYVIPRNSIYPTLPVSDSKNPVGKPTSVGKTGK